MDKANNYYTPEEVSAHNTPGDCWVSFHGKVYNLTSLCEKYAGAHESSVMSACHCARESLATPT